jgi:hypothetical protein
MAWVAAKYPTRTPQLGPGAEQAAATARVHYSYMGSAGRTTSEAGAVAAMAVSLWARSIIAEANGDSAAAASFYDALTGNISASIATVAATFDYFSIWEEVRFDISMLQEIGQYSALDAPLWRGDAPGWAKAGWAQLRAALPQDENWDVWVDWYEDRLREVRAPNITNLFSQAYRSKSGARALRLQTPGSRHTCRNRLRPREYASCRRLCQTSTRPSPTDGPRRSA